jgi:DNA polymerase sigma
LKILQKNKPDSFWEGIEWNRSKLHLGIKNIHLVKSYIKEYVHLKELTLIIKKLLSIKGLNSPYQGGLSSYAIVIMIVAYMNFFSLQNAWINISQLLIHFFDFYSSKFDENKIGILVNRGGSYYPFNSLSDCPIIIKDPLNIENNVGKNTYRISEIKAQFSKASNILEMEKNSYLNASPEELDKIETDLQVVKSENFTDKLMFLNKIFTSEDSKE